MLSKKNDPAVDAFLILSLKKKFWSVAVNDAKVNRISGVGNLERRQRGLLAVVLVEARNSRQPTYYLSPSRCCVGRQVVRSFALAASLTNICSDWHQAFVSIPFSDFLWYISWPSMTC